MSAVGGPFRDVWVDVVRVINAEAGDAEVIRYARDDGAVVWASSLALAILLPAGRFHYLEASGITEADGEPVADKYIDGDEIPAELVSLIPALRDAGRYCPDEAGWRPGKPGTMPGAGG